MRFGQMIIAAGVATTLYLAIGQTPAKKSETPGAKNISPNDLLSHIRGKNAENHDGRDLGKLKDVVIDLNRSTVELAIFSTGGWMGIGKGLKAAPGAAVSTGTAKRGILALDIHTRYWKRVPQLSKRELAQVKLLSTTKKVYDFYQQTGSAEKLAFAWAPNQGTRLTTTGRDEQSRTSRDPRLELASDLLSQEVLDKEGQEIGEISDLLVDFSGRKPVLAIISPNERAALQDAIAVPLWKLKTTKQDKLLLDLELNSLNQASLLTHESWAQITKNGQQSVLRYPEEDATNTRQNLRDRGSRHLTPFDQSNSNADLRLTQVLRRKLMHDSSLSLTAKNIKVITIQGKMTLRGPVRRSHEKETILRIAGQVAGKQNITDDLEIEYE